MSESGGIDILGGDRAKDQATGITVNAYLWRAALDTVAFMPLASADPFGGVILTDWYSQPGSGERTKLNVLVLDRSLRADGIKVKVFKQGAGRPGLDGCHGGAQRGQQAGRNHFDPRPAVEDKSEGRR